MKKQIQRHHELFTSDKLRNRISNIPRANGDRRLDRDRQREMVQTNSDGRKNGFNAK